jgi:hypothetical protein
MPEVSLCIRTDAQPPALIIDVLCESVRATGPQVLSPMDSDELNPSLPADSTVSSCADTFQFWEKEPSAAGEDASPSPAAPPPTGRTGVVRWEVNTEYRLEFPDLIEYAIFKVRRARAGGA